MSPRQRFTGALLNNPTGTRLSPMSRERSVSHLSVKGTMVDSAPWGSDFKCTAFQRSRSAGRTARPVGARSARETESGDPGRARTCDIELRRLALYPAELRGRTDFRSVRYVVRERTEKPSLNSLSYDFPVEWARIESNSSNSDVLRRPSRDDAHQTDAGPRYGKALANARKRRP